MPDSEMTVCKFENVFCSWQFSLVKFAFKQLESNPEHFHLTVLTFWTLAVQTSDTQKKIKKSGWKKVDDKKNPGLELGSLDLESGGQSLCHECSCPTSLN